jgi:hypothetical protein
MVASHIEKTGAEGTEGAGAAIGGGAPTDADKHAGGLARGCIGDEFADAEGIGVEGVELLRLEVEEAVGLGGFNDDVAGVAEAEVAAEDAAAEGIVDDGGGGIGADGTAEGIEEAGPAIGEREDVGAPARPGGADAASDGGRGFIGGEAALELLGRYEDAHLS